MNRYYVFAITKDKRGNIQSFYVMDSNCGNVKIFSYEEMENYLLSESFPFYTAIWSYMKRTWQVGEELQITQGGIIKTVKNNKITDNLESLPTFII
jgi:hypothetical protein